jgi:signal peptidase I
MAALLLASCRDRKLETSSMEPTIQNGEKITENFTAYAKADPQRWDVIVYKNDRTGGHDWCHRVVALPGETIDIQDGYIVINGTKLQYPEKIAAIKYAPMIAGMPPMIRLPYTLPKDAFFVLGDNTSDARDSRYIGHINRKDIQGRVEGK